MNAWKTVGVLVPALMLGVTGCATPGKRTATGAAAGAIVGGAAGAMVGEDFEGAAVGAGVGAVAGAAVGNYLDKQARELEQVADTRRTDEGLLLNLRSELLFETDSAVLTESAIAQVSRIGDILVKYPEDRIRIEGHTDSRGEGPYNEALSMRRAEAVQRVLISRGVQPQQMMVLGMGETEPVAPNETVAGRSANRRVELHIDVPRAS
ncbi:OmpA family protein [Hyalangium rubrum]|uniref:OmpA family protein n=1 Tax=Hyalangium rubrum TaxID=3103134 RepID=A0ABU5H347_9BACT|nr:OmpA family protein [Hyalangium sp. s54d21]MDY7227218.1 OmpA family protein [Hyalangium sp. s54d21]